MTASRPGQHLLGGTLRGLAAEALFPATALVTAAFLTRRLGPQGYGLLTLAAVVVTWVEWSMHSYFARPTIKLIAEAEDWKGVADGIVRRQLIAGVVVMLLLWALSAPLAFLLNEPSLGWYVALYAVDVPLFNLAYAHRNLLIGKGDFTHSANLSAVRWLSRLVLIVGLVGGGLSVIGAILGSIGASSAELLMARRYIRPKLFGRPPAIAMWAAGLPLLVSSVCLGLFNRLDLLALKMMGASAAEVGIYGAAQSLTLLPTVFSLAFMPLLLSTLSRLWSRGAHAPAREIGANTLRGIFVLMPLAAIVAGASVEIVRMFFGADFASAGTVLTILIVGSFSLMVVPVASAIFMALGTPERTPWLTAPLVPLALAGHLLVIPRYGAVGAAVVTTTVALVGASWAVWWIHRVWRVSPPAACVARSLVVSAAAFMVSASWSTPGMIVLLKLPVVAAGALLLFAVLGEFDSDDASMAASVLSRERL